MNNVRMVISCILFIGLICLAAGLKTANKLNKELAEDCNIINISIKQVQSAIVTQSNIMNSAKDFINPFGKSNILNNFTSNAETISKLQPSDIIKNTLIQRDIRFSIEQGKAALNDLELTANRLPKVVNLNTVNVMLNDSKLAFTNTQLHREGTFEAIKHYNEKFDSIPVILIASILGYNKLPVYIM